MLGVGCETSPDGPDTQALKSLPYLSWVPAGETIGLSGVVVHRPGTVFRGFNLYCLRDSTEAHLLDMDGNMLHRWAAETNQTAWQHVELANAGDAHSGDLFAISKDRSMLKMNRDSEISWEIEGRFHHDVTPGIAGNIFALSRTDRLIFESGRPLLVLDDLILVISGEGHVMRQVSLLDILRDRIPARRFDEIARWTYSLPGIRDALETLKGYGFLLRNGMPPDLLHTNSIEVLYRDMAGVGGRGDLLISIRELDMIAVLDLESESIVWSWGPGILSKQHNPTVLDNGNFLIFDNGVSGERSRVVELNPAKQQIVWEYVGTPPESFFSLSRGSCQRLANGNTLITESDKGRAFEVTPGGEIVWDFYNPDVRIETGERAPIYRMARLDRNDVRWLPQ
jgi:hypothetical protein